MWSKILKELEYPPIYMVSPAQFAGTEGNKFMRGDKIYGYAAMHFPIFMIRPGLKGKVKANCIYHEVGHLLFPYRPHWWIECFAEKMAGGGGRGMYSIEYNHTVDDLPSRSQLLKTAIRAGKRLKTLHKERYWFEEIRKDVQNGQRNYH